MHNSKDSIDELFKEGLENLSLEPNSATWAKLSKQLPAKAEVIPWYRKNSGLLLLAFLSCSISFGGGFLVSQFIQDKQDIADIAMLNSDNSINPTSSNSEASFVGTNPNTQGANLNESTSENAELLSEKSEGLNNEDRTNQNISRYLIPSDKKEDAIKTGQNSKVKFNAAKPISKIAVASSILDTERKSSENFDFIIETVRLQGLNNLSNFKNATKFDKLNASIIDLEKGVNLLSKSKGLEFGIYYSYDANFRRHSDDKAADIEGISREDQVVYRNTYGLQSQYHFNKNISVLGRVNLTQKALYSKLTLVQEPVTEENPFGTGNNIIDPEILERLKENEVTETTTTQIEAMHQYQYLEIPLLLQYRFNFGQKLSLSVAAGISGSFLTHHQHQYNINQEGVTENSDYIPSAKANPFLFGGAGEVGIHYQMASHFSINVLNTYRYSFSEFDKNSSYTIQPYTYGVGLGLSYRL